MNLHNLNLSVEQIKEISLANEIAKRIINVKLEDDMPHPDGLEYCACGNTQLLARAYLSLING